MAVRHRIIFYVIGLLFHTFGMAATAISDLGATPFAALFIGLYRQTNLTPGTWMIIICAGVMIANAILAGERPDIFGLGTAFLQGVLVDFWLLFVLVSADPVSIGSRIIWFVAGFAVFVTGISSILQARFAANPLDYLMIALHKRFGFIPGRVRRIYDLTAVGIAWLLGGPVFVGTFALAFFAGTIIQKIRGKMDRFKGKKVEKEGKEDLAA